MTLQQKMCTVFAIAFVAISAAMCAVSYFVIVRSFERVEEKIVLANLVRVRNAVGHQLDHLEATTSDYATWNSTYRFMQGRYRAYVDSEISAQSFNRYGISVFLIFDIRGKLRLCQEFGETPSVCGRNDELAKVSSAIQYLEGRASPSGNGVLMLNGGAMMLSIRPVLRTDGTGPSRGTLVMGRWFDDREVQALARILALHMTAVVANTSGIRTSRALASDGPTEWTEPRGEDVITGWVRIPDLYGRSGLLLSSEFHRDLSREGRVAQAIMLVEISLTALLLNVAGFYLLQKLVLSRVARLSSTADLVSATGDLSHRVHITGNDEITTLEHAFNTMLTDLEELKRELLIAQELLAYSARHDGLTGVLNRAALMSELNVELCRASRENRSVGVMILDLDHFKAVNDTFGHVAGDAVLKAVVDGIRSSTRPYDTVGRYGGEEFVLVAPGVDQRDAIALSERVRRTVEELSTTPRVTISIGVTVSTGGHDPKALLIAADAALYRAKAAGRNRVQFSSVSDAQESQLHGVSETQEISDY